MSNSQADRLAEQIKCILDAYEITSGDQFAIAMGLKELAALAKQQASPEAGPGAESYGEIWNALHRIDSAAAMLPTYAVKHEGGIEAFTQNIIDAITPPSAPQCEQAVPIKEIGDLLADAMNQAVANGANSVSMPDEYVAIAGWLAGNNVGAATEQAPVTSIEPVRPLISRLMVLRVLLAERYPEHHATVFEAINALSQGTTAAAGVGEQATDHKPIVQRIMDLARRFRSAPGSDYDVAYKELESFAYGVLRGTGGEQATGGEFCCEHSWSAAKQMAWKERDLNCGCDHNESCLKCYPAEFREDGRFHIYAPKPAQAEPTGNGGKTGSPPGLLQDDCKGLSQWLASRPDALRRVREACIEIEAQQRAEAGIKERT